ncbi:hypothetical protein niasHS_011062 [Heterodera schachtii]|uniref:OPA3-like protein n=1 Tax=Heterodera schachtii TaxID=97005 RepID=A0ABD2J019_HETSC
MIVARQLSKPITGYFMGLGKEHPAFRNRVLIPIGKTITNWSTKLRMKNLGLGSPTSVVNVSEETALEQASEVIHQVAIFGYTVVVFYAYSYFTHKEEKELASAEELRELSKKTSQEIMRLNVLVTELQDEMRMPRRDRNWTFPWSGESKSALPESAVVNPMMPSMVMTDSQPKEQKKDMTKSISRTEALNRLANATETSS